MLPINTVEPIFSQTPTKAHSPAAAAVQRNDPSSSGSTATLPSNQLTGDSFLTLLSAQLQAQDPLSPIDPTTFVTQLVQFNQLQQLIDINQTLSPSAASSTVQTAGQTNAAQAQAAAQNAALQNAAAQITGGVPANTLF